MQALNEYNGCVVLVSHDIDLIRQCRCQLWICEEAGVRPFEGKGVDQYRDQVLGTL